MKKPFSEHYPYGMLIPKRIRMLTTVRGFQLWEKPICAYMGKIYLASVNRNGAVSAILEDGPLGVKPSEFVVEAWRKRVGWIADSCLGSEVSQ